MVSKATNNSLQKVVQCIYNKAPAFNNISNLQDISVSNNNNNTCSPQKVFNIQLLYDVNQAIEQDSQDGNFYSISLHSSLEHLSSDSKNIKELLQ